MIESTFELIDVVTTGSMWHGMADARRSRNYANGSGRVTGTSIILCALQFVHGAGWNAVPGAGICQRQYCAFSTAYSVEQYLQPRTEQTGVPTTNWMYTAADYLQRHKILLGYPKGYFDGRIKHNHAELVGVVQRAINSCLLPATPDRFIGSGTQCAAGLSPEEARTVRKLHIAFKDELVFSGMSWKQVDEFLLGAQYSIFRFAQRDNPPRFMQQKHRSSGRIVADAPEFESLRRLARLRIVEPQAGTRKLTWNQLSMIVEHACDGSIASVGRSASNPDGGTVNDMLSGVDTLYILAVKCEPELKRRHVNTRRLYQRLIDQAERYVAEQEETTLPDE